MTEQIIQQDKILLVGVRLNDGQDHERSMKELASLAEACGYTAAGVITQNMASVNTAFYIGAGKVAEVKETAALLEADAVLFDDTLSPTQMRNLQEEIALPIFDRTYLILQIFERRAKTAEAKLQVELASLQYMLPRLVGMRASLSRQGGASGSQSSKGAGEKKLELDRRRIEQRLTELRRELAQVEKDRETQRKKRLSGPLSQVCLIGYTNAGKSTLLNAMIDAYVKDNGKKVMEKDMLFATLDTTVRRITAPGGRSFLLADTVGFIDKLPHTLIKAFRSTLEEVRNAGLLLEVIDFSDPNYKEHMRVTEETLRELGAASVPVLFVFNKADLVMEETSLPKVSGNKIYLSARRQIGIERLTQLITDIIFSTSIDCRLKIPYESGAVSSYFLDNTPVFSQHYAEDALYLETSLTPADYNKYEKYIVL